MTTEKNPKALSRRAMLKLSGLVAAGTVLASCQQATTEAPTEAPVEEAPAEEVAPTPEPAQVTGTVTVMHFRHEFTEEQEAQFETDNPGIQIEFVQAEESRFFAMFAAGTPPDLYRLQAPSIPGMLARGLLYNLQPYFDTSELIKMDDLAPANDYYKAQSPLEVGTGPIYGMCKDFSPDFTIYTYSKVFEDNGVSLPSDAEAMSLDQVFDLAKKTTTYEGDRLVTLGYGYEEAWVDRIWMNHLEEIGKKLYSEGFDKIVIAGDEDNKKIVKFFYDLAAEKVVPSSVNPSPNGWFGTDFNAGIMAMAQYGFWYSAMAETDQNRGGVMMMPAPTWTGVRRDPTMTATGMIMTSASKVPDAAFKVFEYYNAGQPSIDRAGSGWGVPALKSQWNLIPQGTDFQKQAYKVLQGELALETPPLQFNPFLGETVVSNSWKKHLDLALKGDTSFDEMIANIETEVNLVIRDNIDAMIG